MITKDLHMHTCYCDGADAPEEMVRSAIEKGLHTVGISAHSYTFFDESYCMQKEEVPRYLAECRYLRAKYFDRIHVLCGVEQDYYSDYPTDDFDYVIGSVHYVKVDEEYFPVDESVEILKSAVDQHFGGDIYALCELYFSTVADVVNKTDCDIIGQRTVTPACSGGSHELSGFDAVLDALGNVSAIVAQRVGYGAQEYITQKGIAVYQMPLQIEQAICLLMEEKQWEVDKWLSHTRS